MSHNTVLQAGVPSTLSSTPSPEPTAVASPSQVSSEHFHTAGLPITGAAEEAAPNDSDSLESFKQALDTAEEELVLLQNVGRRFIDVIRHQNFEYRRDRAAVRFRDDQKWVCRYATKFRCLGQLIIKVRDLENFMDGATIISMRDHNHDPLRLNTFGAVNVVDVFTDESSATGTATEDEGHDDRGAAAQDVSSALTDHAISQLNEGDFSMDFGPGNMDEKARSSPVAGRAISNPDNSGVGTSQDMADASWDLMAISQPEAGAFQAVRHVMRFKEEDVPTDAATDSSGTQL